MSLGGDPTTAQIVIGDCPIEGVDEDGGGLLQDDDTEPDEVLLARRVACGVLKLHATEPN